MKLILLALGTIFLLSFVVAVAYVYAQPIEENWLNVPSHAVNGEIEIYVPMEDNPIPYLRTPISEAQPDLSAIDINFDIKNQSMKFEPNATFSFDSNDRLMWSGGVEVPINNQTFRKMFDLEVVVYNTKQDEYGKVYYVNGTLKIGNQIWDPIFGGIYTNNAGCSVSNLYFYSRVDHYPDFKNN